MKKTLLLVLFMNWVAVVNAQSSALLSFLKLSGPEKWWVAIHPFVAGKAFKITLEARAESNKMFADSLFDRDPIGGQIDAFRHAYWMARMSQVMKWKKAVKLGQAHEKANYITFKKHFADEEGVLSDSVSMAMDLFNNSVGAAIGCNFKTADKSEIYKLVSEALINGKLKIIRKNLARQETDCEGKVIDTSLFSGKWVIPKCLVPSDQAAQ